MFIICRQYRRGSGQIFVKICTKRANDLYLHPVLCRMIPPLALNPTHLVSIEIKSILCPFSETTTYYLLLPMLLFIKTPLSGHHPFLTATFLQSDNMSSNELSHNWWDSLWVCRTIFALIPNDVLKLSVHRSPASTVLCHLQMTKVDQLGKICLAYCHSDWQQGDMHVSCNGNNNGNNNAICIVTGNLISWMLLGSMITCAWQGED